MGMRIMVHMDRNNLHISEKHGIPNPFICSHGPSAPSSTALQSVEKTLGKRNPLVLLGCAFLGLVVVVVVLRWMLLPFQCLYQIFLRAVRNSILEVL